MSLPVILGLAAAGIVLILLIIALSSSGVCNCGSTYEGLDGRCVLCRGIVLRRPAERPTYIPPATDDTHRRFTLREMVAADEEIEIASLAREKVKSSGSLRFIQAQPTDEQRTALVRSDLCEHGDCCLVWVNEGDLHQLPMSAALNSALLDEARKAVEYLAALLTTREALSSDKQGWAKADVHQRIDKLAERKIERDEAILAARSTLIKIEKAHGR